MVKFDHQSGRAKGNSGRSRVVVRACKAQEEIRPPDVAELKLLLMSLLDDVHNKLTSVYTTADFLRDKATLSRRLDREGSTFATSMLPAIFDGIVSILEGGAAHFPNFKTLTRKGITYPVVLSGLVKHMLGHRDTEIGTECLGAIYQISYAFKKVLGPYKPEGLYKQLVEFVEVDDEIKYCDYLSEPLREVTREARNIITNVLRGLNPFDPGQAQEFMPKPGPGATNTPLKMSERFQLHSDYLNISDVFDQEEWFRPPFAPPRGPWKLSQGTGKQYIIRAKKRPPKEVECVGASTSRFKFVPKTNKKARGICIEENEVQWLQQALRSGLVKRIESHPLTRGFVNFTSQNINRKLALSSSQTGHLATLDMSSASDRISRKLVAYLFSGNKPLLDAILAVSSETIKLPEIKGLHWLDKELPINKIAPMGSAICFPIMALVHFSLIKAILKFSATVPRELTREVYVYGDDIIINSECVQAIYDYLPLYGMKFNTEKSFFRSRFRESCGLHAYEGIEITPVRFKIAYQTPSFSDVPGLLRLEEALYNKGYRKTAEHLRIQIQRVCLERGIKYWYPVPTNSPLLGFYRPEREASLEDIKLIFDGAFDTGTQTHWYKLPVVKAKTVLSPPLADEEGYLRWLVLQSRGKKTVDDVPRDNKIISWVWLPTSALS